MRIDTSEPSLTALFNKGQVGLIRTEFMRKDDVIAGLRAENTALWGEKDALAAENERLKASQLSLEKWIACEQVHFETADNLREKLYQASVQIERLHKAGDAMARCIQPPAHGPGEYESEYDAWFAAKEGRDA